LFPDIPWFIFNLFPVIHAIDEGNLLAIRSPEELAKLMDVPVQAARLDYRVLFQFRPMRTFMNGCTSNRLRRVNRPIVDLQVAGVREWRGEMRNPPVIRKV